MRLIDPTQSHGCRLTNESKVFAYASYVQIPYCVGDAFLQVALSPQFIEARHSRMQYLLPLPSCRAHCGMAVTLLGLSWGHEESGLHLGAQTSPVMPVMAMAISSDEQPTYGSS